MGKIKSDDKSSTSAKSCKNEVKCKEFSYSAPKKNRSDNVGLKLPKDNLRVSHQKFYLHSTTEKGCDVSRTREKGSISRCVLRNMMKNKAAENKKEIITTKATEMTLSCRSGYTASCSSSSKSHVPSKRRINDELSQRCSDDEQPTSKRSKQFGRPTPAVHIQRLNGTERALFSFSDKYENVETKSAKTALTKTAADLSESDSKNCQLFNSHEHEMLVKYEPDFYPSLAVESQKSDRFKVKQEHNCDDDRSVKVADVAVAKHGNEKAGNAVIPLLTKFDEELKSAKQSLNISADRLDSDSCEGLTEGKQSNEIVNSAAACDSSCGDVVILSVDNIRGKTTRRSRNEIPRKRSEADDITCGMLTSIKREPCVEDGVATAVISTHETNKPNVREFVCDFPDKTARTSSKNSGVKAPKKTRLPTKSKHSASTVSPSILTRSMIKIPG